MAAEEHAANAMQEELETVGCSDPTPCGSRWTAGHGQQKQRQRVQHPPEAHLPLLPGEGSSRSAWSPQTDRMYSPAAVSRRWAEGGRR